LGRHRDLRQRDLDIILRATMLRLDEAGLDWREIGIHAFFVTHGFWGERLMRVGRLRMSQRPASQPKVRWIKGKGVIGRCWVTGRYVVVNVAPLYREHAQTAPEEWDTEPPAKRMGMTHEEMTATREYGCGAIAAGPVLDPDGRFHGCVAVDAPEGNYKRLREPAVQQAVQDACTSLWALTRARVGWVAGLASVNPVHALPRWPAGRPPPAAAGARV
jgi:hypothetical protein